MFKILFLNTDIVYKVFLNTILVSIPEEIYLVMITLILIGEFDYWKEEECKKIINKWDYSRILIPSITTGLIINIFKYTNHDSLYSSLICLFIFYVLIALTNDILKDSSPFKWLAKAFIFLIIGQISIGLTEYLYVPLVIYATGKNAVDFNSDILLNFFVSLPSRLMQYSILAVMISMRRKKHKGSFLTYLTSNGVLLVILSVTITFDFFFLFIIYRAIVFKNLFFDLSSQMQFLIIICAIIFPLLNISGSLWAVFYVKNQEINERNDTLNKLEIILDYINEYKDEKRCEDIAWKLNEIGIAVEEIAVGLNKGENPEKRR